MKACFQSVPTSDLLKSEGFQTNADSSSCFLVGVAFRQLPYLIRSAACGLGVFVAETRGFEPPKGF